MSHQIVVEVETCNSISYFCLCFIIEIL